MPAHVFGLGVREARLERRPVGSGGDATGSYPDRQQKLRRVSRGGKPSGPAVAKPGALHPNVELHEVGFVNESLIPDRPARRQPRVLGCTRSRKSGRRPDPTSMCSARWRPRSASPVVSRARAINRHHRAHGNPRVGIVQRCLVETYPRKKGPGIVAHGPEARDQRLHGSHGEEWLGRDHALTIVQGKPVTNRDARQCRFRRSYPIGSAHPL